MKMKKEKMNILPVLINSPFYGPPKYSGIPFS